METAAKHAAGADLAGQIVAFATGLADDRIPAEVTERLKACIVDSIACALSARDDDAARAARDAVLRLCGEGPAALWGTGLGSSADLAAFANGVAIRCQDWSDTYLTPTGGLHPSDMISALLALGQSEHRSGRDLIRGLAVSYEVGCRIREASHVQLRSNGWDSPTLLGPATACGAAVMLGLDAGRTLQALAIAGVACASTFQIRVGHLSTWKGAAGADAAHRGVFAAILAASGLTGPDRIFDGEYGLCRLVTGDFTWPADGAWRTLEVYLKQFPALAATHAAIGAALALHERGVRAADIERIVIHAFDYVITRHTTPEKWHPRTRETADHSLPFCVSVALLDGFVIPAQFEPERRGAADVRDLIARVEVVEDASYTALWPDSVASRVEVRLRSGRTEHAEVRLSARGARPTPSRADVQRKLAGAPTPAAARARDGLAARIWDLEQVQDLADLPLRDVR